MSPIPFRRYFLQSLILDAPLMALIVIVMLLMYATEADNQRASIESSELRSVHNRMEVIGDYFQSTLADLRLLSNENEVSAALETPNEATKMLLQIEFSSFTNAKPEYRRICLFDIAGSLLSCSPPENTPPDGALPSLPGAEKVADLFRETSSVMEDEAWVGWAAEAPAMFRFCILVTDAQNAPLGLIMLDYETTELIQALNSIDEGTAGLGLLITPNGSWITPTGIEEATGSSLFSSQGQFSANLPQAWDSIQQARQGQFYNQDGLFTFNTVGTVVGGLQPVVDGTEDAFLAKIVSRVPTTVLDTRFQSIQMQYFLRFATFALPTLIIVALISRILVRRRQTEQDLAKALEEQKSVLTKLTESENRFRGVLENASIAIIIVSDLGEIRMINQRVDEMFGYAREELIGQPVEMLVPRRYREVHQRHRGKYIEAPRPRMMGAGLELYARRKDGTEFPVEIGLSTIQTKDGLLVMSYLTDVTERKKSEEALKLSENKYRHLFENTLVGMYRTRKEDGAIIEANSALHTMFGFETMIGLNAADMYEDATDREILLNMLQNEGEVVNFETRMVRKNGENFWVSLSATWYPNEGYMEGVLVDISERKRVEQELERSLSILQATLESTADAIIALDTNGRPVNFNRQFFDMWGVGENILAKSAAERAAMLAQKVDDAEAFTRHMVGMDSKADVDIFDIIKLKDGRTLERYIRPQRIGKQVVGHVWNIRDVTERDRAVQALQRALDETKLVTAQLTQSVRELERRAFEADLLNELGDMLQSCNSPEEAYTVVARYGKQLFPDNSGALGVVNPSRNLVEIVANWGEPHLHEEIFELNSCWALRRGQIHEEHWSDGDVLCNHLNGRAAQEYLCVPLLASSEPLGILHIQAKDGHDKEGDQTFIQPLPGASATVFITEHTRQLAIGVAERIALSLANLRLRESLHEQAIHDPLTGLFNRRHMNDVLEREVHRAGRRQTPLSLIMMDIDFFKQFNDRYGHPAGDILLREIAAFLLRHVRAEDIVCRYGGEEFILILPGATLEDGQRRAEQLWEETRHIEVNYHGQILDPVTLSFGLAVYPEHGDNAEILLRSADDALYKAKAAGRNNIVIADKP